LIPNDESEVVISVFAEDAHREMIDDRFEEFFVMSEGLGDLFHLPLQAVSRLGMRS